MVIFRNYAGQFSFSLVQFSSVRVSVHLNCAKVFQFRQTRFELTSSTRDALFEKCTESCAVHERAKLCMPDGVVQDQEDPPLT